MTLKKVDLYLRNDSYLISNAPYIIKLASKEFLAIRRVISLKETFVFFFC